MDSRATLNELLPTTPDLREVRLAELNRLFPDLFTNEVISLPASLSVFKLPTLTDAAPQARLADGTPRRGGGRGD